MKWKSNSAIPMGKEKQEAACRVLCQVAGVDFEHPGKNGERMGYAGVSQISRSRERMGTCCGTKGNIFSKKMVSLLSEAEHILMCWYQDKEGRCEVAAMMVKGLSFAQAEELSGLAKGAGGSLRPEVVNVDGEPWVAFESE